MTEPVLIDGTWRAARAISSFHAMNPSNGDALEAEYPISHRDDALEAIEAGWEAAQILRNTDPEKIAQFLEIYAELIEFHRDPLVSLAQRETGLAAEPRLNSVELPRTTNQLRIASRMARDGQWTRPVIDASANIRSIYAPLGAPVVIFGPNNFPFAFNGVSGGDFAAALVARNPVIVKGNPAHPGTTQQLAQLALQAIVTAGLPPATVQLLYALPDEAGLELVAHARVGASAFTGSKRAGLALKAAADATGRLFYGELSSINPVFILPGALIERSEAIAEEYFGSCTAAAGQFCTSPGLLFVPTDEIGTRFVTTLQARFQSSEPGVLLTRHAPAQIAVGLATLQSAGAQLLAGGTAVGPGFRFQNTLLGATLEDFLKNPLVLQTEVFGPVGLIVRVDTTQMSHVAMLLEGNLTGTIYSSFDGRDDAIYNSLEVALRARVGRLLNDKMPTGVAVSPAMNHGGPYPSTGHPGFTAVGLPSSIARFVALHCYDNVRVDRLPKELR